MFITLEGIDGCGKTSQLKYIENFLKSSRIDYIITREPGGTAIGEKIRALLLSPENTDIVSEVELLLYTADRCQHLKTKIIPALEKGIFVISDRFFDATLAYQGYGRKIDKRIVKNLHKIINKDFKPDITFLLDLSPEISIERTRQHSINLSGIKRKLRKSEEITRFELEKLDFHKRVRDGYLEIAKNEPERFCIIDASKDINAVSKDIIDSLSVKISDIAINAKNTKQPL